MMMMMMTMKMKMTISPKQGGGWGGGEMLFGESLKTHLIFRSGLFLAVFPQKEAVLVRVGFMTSICRRTRACISASGNECGISKYSSSHTLGACETKGRYKRFTRHDVTNCNQLFQLRIFLWTFSQPFFAESF